MDGGCSPFCWPSYGMSRHSQDKVIFQLFSEEREALPSNQQSDYQDFPPPLPFYPDLEQAHLEPLFWPLQVLKLEEEKEVCPSFDLPKCFFGRLLIKRGSTISCPLSPPEFFGCASE